MADFFKKVIGQGTPETTPNSPSASDSYRPAAPAAPAPAATSSTAPAASRPATGASRNVLSSDVDIKGIVKFTNDLVVDGKIEGEITSDGNLTVGENARIKAEVKTNTVVVYGKVHGNIIAAERVDLKSTAEVVGDIRAKVLSIEAGATFVGKSTVGAATQATSGTPAPAQQKPTPGSPAPKTDLLAGAGAKI
ncbi:MAG: polymer-forming cytoskeletal protein [Verrucomicrobiota bacterium]